MAYIGKQPKKLGAGEDLPSQAGQTGKFLKSDGSTTSWAESDGSPSIDDNGNATAITISSAENVGISTSTPRARLDLGANGTSHTRWGSWSELGEESSHNSLVLGSNVYVNGSASQVRATSNDGYRAIKMKYSEGMTFHTTDASVTADDTLGNERMRISPSGNVGIGTTGYGTYHSSDRVLSLGAGSTIRGASSGADPYSTFATNAFHDASAWKYIHSDYASSYEQYNGNHTFQVAPSGTAGSTISFTSAMIMDSAGRVTMPSQPACLVGLTSHYTTTNSVIPWNIVHYNQGSHYSTANDRFTCPVTGYYQVSIMVMSAATNHAMDVSLKVNGTDTNQLAPYNAATGGSYNQVSGTAIIYASANDYFSVNLNSGSVYGTTAGRHNSFGIRLVG